jgi:hypothetical protein
MSTGHAEELLKLARLADQEKPAIGEKLERLRAAAAQPGAAGELRALIHRGQQDLWDLSRATGISMQSIDGFLQGQDLALSEFIKLANSVGRQVVLETAATE